MLLTLFKAGGRWDSTSSQAATELVQFFFTEITFLLFAVCLRRRPAQFLPEMVAAMKGNSTLKGLRLPGNRLGGDRALRRGGGRSQSSDLETQWVKAQTSPLGRQGLGYTVVLGL